MRRLLLLSNSTNHGGGYLDHAWGAIQAHFGESHALAFVPFALKDTAMYTARVEERFARPRWDVLGLTGSERDAERLAKAEAIFVGGGNTFRLLDRLQQNGLIEVLRRRIASGVPYLGASAGTNIAAPTLQTTNDMPIVQPHGFEAIGAIGFQINPHYQDADPDSKHMGETREERILEFLEENDRPVLGLREGSWIQVAGREILLGGPRSARVFRRGHEPEEVAPGSSLAPLLEPGGPPVLL